MQRINQIKSWLQDEIKIENFELVSASSDASFRRYFRVQALDGGSAVCESDATLIVMDAPPEKEDTAPFIKIATMMADMGLNVPLIRDAKIDHGFLLLSDLGSTQYLNVLNEDNVQGLYQDALDALLKLQQKGPKQSDHIPPYDYKLLMQEMELFRQWYLKTHLGLELTGQEEHMLDNAFDLLANTALEQPHVCVHRDYHSRNLMHTDEQNPGILDFQDAVIGPISYDLVSLLRDCYIEWPREQVEAWALNYLNNAVQAGLTVEKDNQRLLQWFDWMGVQRHLKAIGIFARLNHRDNKPGYLNDIPRTLSYVVDVCSRYKKLEPLHKFLQHRVSLES